MPAPPISRRLPCPCCSQGPLVFVSCRSCGAVLGWCGEEDYAVGIYDGTDLRSLGLGETRDWAREGCPICKGNEMEHSRPDEVERLGFTSSDLMSPSS